MQRIKGEASCRINKLQLTKERIGWQGAYFSASVSESAINEVTYFKTGKCTVQKRHCNRNRMNILNNGFEKFKNSSSNSIWSE